ncbi:MAG: hypothetical protein MIO93_10855 [ANME-2 cluster archaeon]|jgi:hypothetical protein|nr:hypothetical protein [ANME-2 cluster archaeon]
MKKILIISILIIGIVFISGCTSEDNTKSETSTSTQSNQESDSQNSELIIKPSDVPELRLLSYQYFAYPKSESWVEVITPHAVPGKYYEDTLPIGYRYAGQLSTWGDDSGRRVNFVLAKYDSNSGFLDHFNEIKQYGNTKKENPDSYKNFEDGDPKIGENSYYSTEKDIVETTQLEFTHENDHIYILVTDEANTLNEAIRLAKIIESRLD